ncbi:MAG: UMP kinase [Methanomicrobia archaeon]|nr:UMP kinase [Methanomicrobia archaeon]
MKIVLKFGGSVLFEDERINTRIIKRYAYLIDQISQKHEVNIVVGGGELARKYIEALDNLGAPESFKDLMGIEISRINAQLFITALKDLAYPVPPKNFDEVIRALNSGKIVVCGGLIPGQSTNAVASFIAEQMGADQLINITDVDYVYTDDPKLNPEAKPIEEMKVDDFIDLIMKNTGNAGTYKLFDVTAAQIIRRSRILLKFVSGKDPENILKAVNNEKVGTIIRHELRR